MEIKDQHIFFKTAGKQLTFILLMMLWAILLFAISITIPFEGITATTIRWILATLSLFLAIYFLGYALILTRKIVEKYYR